MEAAEVDPIQLAWYIAWALAWCWVMFKSGDD